MNVKHLAEGLENSEIFKNFKKEHPDSFFCAGFFIFDFKQQREEYSLDYRSGSRIFSFNISLETGEITIREEEILDSSQPLEEVNINTKVEIPELRKIAEAQLQKNSVKHSLEKIIAILQNSEGKIIWNLTCMCSDFAVIIIHINAQTGDILKFDSKNLFDFVKKD